jgi:CBS domain-containing protein
VTDREAAGGPACFLHNSMGVTIFLGAPMICVSELMTPSLVQVSSDTPLATCALRMDHLQIRHLAVVRPDGRLQGVLTDAVVHRHGMVFGGQFVSYELNDALVASDLALHSDVVAHPDDELVAVMRLLVRTRQDWVVVVDERGHPVGLVTEHDLLKAALLAVPEGLTVDQLPQRHVITFCGHEPASLALDAMIRQHIRHIPVTRIDGTVIGVVSYRDLVAEDVSRRTVLLEDARSTDVLAAKPGDSLLICAARMMEHHVGCLPVLSKGRAVGIVTRRDLMEAAAAGLEDEELFEAAH